MLKQLTIALLLVGLALAAVPGASAMEDPGAKQCLNSGIRECDGPYEWTKEKVDQLLGDLDPRDWPCTCDPMPQPW